MENVSTSMFVDDKAICSSDVQQVMADIQVWEEASQALGLKETQGKMGIVCFAARQHRQLVEQGVRPETSKDQIRILGIDVAPNGGCEAATMAKRSQENIAILTRLAFCPIGREFRRALYRSRLIPLLSLAETTAGLCGQGSEQHVQESFPRTFYGQQAAAHYFGGSLCRSCFLGSSSIPSSSSPST